MPRFDDCESCAFYEREPAICDECEDADQWEPADESDWLDMFRARGGFKTKVIRIRAFQERRRKAEESAVQDAQRGLIQKVA